MPNPLENKFIALGVSGSIACHKAVDLASKLTQQGALVDVVMTTNALNFVTPLAFQAITHRPVVSNLFDPQSEVAIDHVAVAERADAMVIAPATANTIARMAWGLADDALTTTVLATRAPIIVCPAMDGYMYENPATQENPQRLSAWGHTIAGPAEGRMASGLKGKGRMLEVPEILGHVSQVLGRGDDRSLAQPTGLTTERFCVIARRQYVPERPRHGDEIPIFGSPRRHPPGLAQPPATPKGEPVTGSANVPYGPV